MSTNKLAFSIVPICLYLLVHLPDLYKGSGIVWPNLPFSGRITKKSVRLFHDDVIKWKHFLRYWSYVRGFHRSPLNSPLKGQWRGALVFSLICARINGWVNNRESGDLRRYRAHYDVMVMPRLRLRQLTSRRLNSYSSSPLGQYIETLYCID